MLDSIQAQSQLDWFKFETQIKRDVHGLLRPFQDALESFNKMAQIKYKEMESFDSRMQQLEE